MKITLPIYYTFEYKTKKPKRVLVGLNWYRNVNHFSSNKVKAYYHELIAEQVGDTVLETPIRAKFAVYQARNNVDGHNVRPVMEKFLYDGLQECGAIENDSTPKYISGDRGTDYFIDKENPRIEIEI